MDRIFVYFLRKKEIAINHSDSILIGYNDYSQNLINEIDKNKYLGYTILNKYPNADNISEIIDYISNNNIKSVFVNTDMLQFNNGLESKMRELSENSFVKFYSISELYSSKLKRSSYLLVGKIPILPIFTFPLDSEFNRIIKRIFDIAFSLFIIIFFLSWIFPLVVLFIYISSPGNVFYTHKRIGINNLPFTCFKFRTMKVSDTSEPFQQTIKNDHRVFWFGKFLRKWNIDELPQFFNSLLGDISVVGPRPMMIGHIKEFDSEIKEMYSRHYIKPGITGLAQVMGYRGEIDGVQKMKGRIKMDRYYIQNWSFFLDFKIIWWTIRNTIFGDENAI